MPAKTQQNVIFGNFSRPRTILAEMHGKSEQEEKDGIWKAAINMRHMPTKFKDLKIEFEEDQLVVSGKSQFTEIHEGRKIKNNREWTKKIKLPEMVDREKIKAILDDKNVLRLSGDKTVETGKEIKIVNAA